ncbi:hypothetical protein [Agrobacterium sp. CFBP2214]|uniref:hypothetical protein n=1 Tax=Agrobacterium sp. CFBP2214 TaxID=3040274 RepID=UPI00254A5DC8|nr:hypothetical protein [Agrobacterium sp. CFBP2214]
MLGALDARAIDKTAKDNEAWNAGKFGEIASLLAGGGGVTGQTAASTATGSTIPMTSAAGEVSATSPVTGDTFAPFMDTIKTSVQNPYALAAIAATGRAESGWSAANANRTWSDPSESGQPGRAGGIMSWRGPRYQALAATGDLSPQGQAKFFLNEDPALIQKLNGAKSVEEAQQLMNNAWAFAGYNRPGGESARRLAFAKGYLPSFQGAATEVASLDPTAGMPAVQAIEVAAPASRYVDPMVSVQPRAPALPAPQTVATPPSVAQPQQVAQATAPGGQPIPPAIMEVLSDPRADARTRGIAEILLKQNMSRQQAAEEMRLKQSDPAYQLGLEKSRLEVENLRNPRVTNSDKLARERFDWEKENGGRTSDIKEYEYARERGYEGSFVDFQLAQKKAGAGSTNVTVGEGDKFYENLDKKNAETFATLSDEGVRSRAKMGQIDRLEALLANSPTGAGAAFKQALGEWGIPTAKLDDIQATQALINELVPQQRQPGSGPMSDADLALFKQSLPRIINQPGGNTMILNAMRGITQYQVQMGEIADAVADRSLKPAEGRKMIRELKNPLEDFTKVLRDKANGKSKAPEGVDASDWEFMTPEERRLFE